MIPQELLQSASWSRQTRQHKTIRGPRSSSHRSGTSSAPWSRESSSPVLQVVKEMVEVDQIIHQIQNCRCASGDTTPRTNNPDNSKTMEIPQIQFLDRVVDVPVDEHIDYSCDSISDFQMEVVSKERCARSLMIVSLMRVEPAIVLTR